MQSQACIPLPSFVYFVHRSIRCLFFYTKFRSKVMARNGYKKISNDADKEKLSCLSLLFFHWMNDVFKMGNERALEENDFLPLAKENTSCSVIQQLQARWNDEQRKCKGNGKKPKLWKSVVKMLSVKDVVILISTNAVYSLCRILEPLFLGYLLVSLTSSEPQNNYLMYGCALAMVINSLLGRLSMHHLDYRYELLGIRISSALKGLLYIKVSHIRNEKKN